MQRFNDKAIHHTLTVNCFVHIPFLSTRSWLLRPRERLRCIVMSMSVCGSVCREIISGTTRATFTNFVHVACVCGSIFLRQVYDRPNRLSPGRGFLPYCKCIIGRKMGDGSAWCGRSMLSTIALFVTQGWTEFLETEASGVNGSEHMFTGQCPFWRPTNSVKESTDSITRKISPTDLNRLILSWSASGVPN